jgi:uncharacterized protein
MLRAWRSIPAPVRLRYRGLLFAITACLGFTPALSKESAPARLATVRPTSFHLTMRDGVRIAVDLTLPQDLRPGDKIPALVRQTRYYRSFDLGWRLQFLTRNWPSQRKLYVAHGYAWLDVDVRGTGASFGEWVYPWSPDAIRDGGEIVDWIVRQPWSNGKVGAIGTSYDGVSAELLLANRQPAVKAVAPEFTFFDAYSDLVFPGGIWLQSFSNAWQRLNRALDTNYLKSFTALMPRAFRASYHGVRPVDADGDRVLLREAIAGHEHNLDVAAMARAITYRDDAPWPPGTNLDAMSPFSHASDISASGAAIFFVEGWLDASFPQAALNAYATLRNPVRVIIGPWGHGNLMTGGSRGHKGRSDVDPDDLLLAFFDSQLKGQEDQTSPARSISYFTLGASRWNTTGQWPPPEVQPIKLYLGRDRRLDAAQPPPAEGSDHYQVNLSAATGLTSRWDLGTAVAYPDRREADKKLLCYNSGPLASDLEVTGAPGVNLFLGSTAVDGEFFAYLEDVDPKGRVAYVTEGELRGVDRARGLNPPYPQAVPYHSFKQSDSQPLRPGEIASISFAMVPTSYLFGKGHTIRLALAGADRDHFAILSGSAPAWTVYHDAAHPSSLELPVKDESGNRTRH